MSNVYDIVIVGGGPAGLTAAAVAAESGAQLASARTPSEITEPVFPKMVCERMMLIHD